MVTQRRQRDWGPVQITGLPHETTASGDARFSLLSRRVIRNRAGEPYLVRWTLLSTPWFSVKVHHILLSDADRCEHDHPWPFVSLILWGGYVEHVHDRASWIGPGRLRYCPAHWRHRLELDRPAWTLVVTGPRCREWGFWTRRGWMSWRRYDQVGHQEGLC